jgi:hypothetical protein
MRLRSAAATPDGAPVILFIRIMPRELLPYDDIAARVPRNGKGRPCSASI